MGKGTRGGAEGCRGAKVEWRAFHLKFIIYNPAVPAAPLPKHDPLDPRPAQLDPRPSCLSHDGNILPKAQVAGLIDESEELIRILTSIVKSSGEG